LERAVLQSDGATNLEKALRRAQELFQQPQFRAARKDLYLFTDLQAAGWSRRRTSETFPELLRDLSRQAVVCIVDAGDAARENVALVELEPSDLLATAEMPISVTAQVRNFGLTDQAGVPVELYVDPGGSAEDRPADRITLNLEAGKTAAAEFKVRLPSGGDHRLEARIGEDRLAADNRRGCVVEVVEELRFLLVEGRGREGGRPGEAEFLRAALSAVPTGGEGLVQLSGAGAVQSGGAERGRSRGGGAPGPVRHGFVHLPRRPDGRGGLQSGAGAERGGAFTRGAHRALGRSAETGRPRLAGSHFSGARSGQTRAPPDGRVQPG
jgi:hypothetical protein